MDTEAIASEIVIVRNRLDELSERMERGDGEVSDEQSRLMDRLRHLQNQLDSGDSTDGPPVSEDVGDVPLT